MAYAGSQKIIRFGQFGLMTDLAQDNLPDGSLIRAENVQYLNHIIERADEITDWVYGNPEYQTPQYTTEKPIGVHRFNPFPKIERQIVVTDKGNVYKYNSPFYRIPVTVDPTSPSTPATLSSSGTPMMISGGNEVQGNEKKVFIFTGNSQVQVITGDGTTRRNITTPSPDWTAPANITPSTPSVSYPTFGIIFRGQLMCFGVLSNPHTMYASSALDQEDFNADDPNVTTFSCFPGEGEGIYSAFVFKTKLFVLKKPYGLYGLVDTDPSPSNWYFQRVSSSLGIASPNSFFEGTDDMYVLSNDGSIISMTAALRLGDIFNSDMLSGLYTSTFFRQIVRNQYLYKSFGKFLNKKKIGVFAFPSYLSIDGYCDSLIYIDFNGTSPRISWHRYLNTEVAGCDFFKDPYGDDQFLFTKLKFSSNVYSEGCLATYFPAYSTNTPFRIQTANSNLGVEGNKEFDGFELMYESTDVYPLAVDVYVDSKFSESFLIQPFYGDAMAPAVFTPDPDTCKSKFANPLFKLDCSYLEGRGTRPKWNSLHARGQTISFVIRDGDTIDPPYTSGPNKDDSMGDPRPIKITGVRVYYRVAGQDQKSQSK